MGLPPIHLVTQWREPSAPHADACVFVPALARFPPGLREIVGLLPVADINGALLEAIARRERCEAVGDLVAGIFAADPFLDLVDLAERLREAGIARIANFPTLQHFDGATAEGLSAVGYDFQAEFAVLKRLAAAGFEPVGYVATVKAAEAALASGLKTLAYHPGPPPVPSSERATLAKIEGLAGEAGAQLLLHTLIAADEVDGDQPISP
jgi:predicted TIM-barrel enzyme